MPALVSLFSTIVGFLFPLPLALRSMPNDAIAPVRSEATNVLSIFIWIDPQIRDRQQCGAPSKHSAFDDISNADAFLFVLLFGVGGHDATELPLQSN